VRGVTQRRKLTTPQWVLSGLFIVLVTAPTWWLYRSVRIARVPSRSMEPTLVPGDVLAVRVDAFRQATPRRGDIIIFRASPGEEWLVKRVVGVPGEKLVVFRGHVLTPRGWLAEPYAQGGRVLERPLPVQLGADEVFVLGDNRDHADDSRDFGPVKLSQIVGRVAAILWPLPRRGPVTGFTDDLDAAAPAK
jgi:signal peptidase I